MKKLFSISILLLQSLFLLAQQPELARLLALETGEQMERWGLDTLYESAGDYTKISNHPYLSTSWFKGDLFLSDGTQLSDIIFRYNIFEDVVEVLLLGHRYNLNPRFVRKFVFRDPKSLKKRIFRNDLGMGKGVRDSSLDSLAYLEILYKGEEVVVLRHWSVEVVASTAKTNTGPSVLSYRFREKQEKAFVVKRGSLFPVSFSREGFLLAFSDRRPAMEDFLDRWEIPCKSTEDLARTAKYYDALSASAE